MTQTTERNIPRSPALPGRPAGPDRTPRPRVALAIVLLGQFMALLDVAIVNVAAPSIRTDLGASGSELQLVISGYTITYAVLLITGARLGQRWGYDRVFQAGVALFTLASLACGLAPNVATLIGFRLVQGVGAALLVPQVVSMIQQLFTGPARVRALGAFTAVVASGMALGQVVGGVLVTADLFGSGWRPVFLLNVPVGAILLILGRRELPAFARVHRVLDVPGLITLAAAVLLLVVPLVLGHDQGWPVWGWVMLAGSALCLLAFAVLEGRLAARGGHPLIHGRVVRAPGLAASLVSIFLIMAGVAGFLFAVAVHLQSALGQTPLHVGLTFASMAVGFGLAGLWWRKLPASWHPWLAFPALVVSAVGYAVLGRALDDGKPLSAAIGVMLFATGVLVGCGYGQLFASALSRVPTTDAADASGVVVTVIQLGNVVGVATLGTLYLTAVDGGSSAARLAVAAHSGHAAELAMFAVATVTALGGAISLLRPRAVQV
jgi:MFS family permease